MSITTLTVNNSPVFIYGEIKRKRKKRRRKGRRRKGRKRRKGRRKSKRRRRIKVCVPEEDWVCERERERRNIVWGQKSVASK